MTPELVTLTVLFLLLGFVLVALGAQVWRRQRRVRLALRRIPAYRNMPVGVAEAVESERPMHISFGGSGLGSDTTVSALATAEVLYHLAERAAIAYQPPIITLSDPTALGLAQGTLRRAYQVRQNMEAYRPSAARWYPQGPRSLAFAVGVGAALSGEDANMSVLAGSFGPELAFIGEAASRYDQLLFAQSDQLDGQAVAWVMSDTPLIGEELYVAGSYLPERPSPLHMSQLLAMELLRLVVIVGIVLAAVLAIAERLGPALILLILGGTGLVVLLGLVLFLRAATVREES